MLSPYSKGGVRDIARAIEQGVTDGLIDSRGAGATQVRIVADGAATKVIALDAKSGTPAAKPAPAAA